MTENQIDGITKALLEVHQELSKIRERMATKADLAELDRREYRPADQPGPTDWMKKLEHHMDELDRQHVDMLYMLQDHERKFQELRLLRSAEAGETRTQHSEKRADNSLNLIGHVERRFDGVTSRLLDRIEALEISRKRHEQMIGMAQTDQSDMLHSLKVHEDRLDEIRPLLRPAGTGETRTRPDAGASRVKDHCCECDGIIHIPVLDAPGICADCCALLGYGGSGNPPAAPTLESGGTEQRQEDPRLEDKGEYWDTKGF